MSAHVSLNLLNKQRNRDKMQGFAEHFITFFAMSLINSIKILELECSILFIICRDHARGQLGRSCLPFLLHFTLSMRNKEVNFAFKF